MKKHIIFSVLFAALAVAFVLVGSSCRRASHNGKIDGFWRIDRIEVTQPGEEPETIIPDNRFIAIQLELMQLCKETGLPDHHINNVVTGVISYDKGAETLVVDFRQSGLSNLKLLSGFGIYENPVTFKVVTATSKKLVLKSPVTCITCSKF